MTRELFVSSTPHETKVGLVEDDQLAEIYLERENEYTLAGSIYKGRVTRVLPGMQSAFVDIGLERDAFLYVSDFMELEDSEDIEEIPANRAVPVQGYQPALAAEAHPVNEAAPLETEAESAAELPEASGNRQGEEEDSGSAADSRDNRGGWRNRRRRRGGRRPERGDRNERTDHGPETRLARPGGDAPREPHRPQRTDYGPPQGYQPILLPGESISKYQRLAQAPPSIGQAAAAAGSPVDRSLPIAGEFPDDEPLFAKPQATTGLPRALEAVLSAPVAEPVEKTEAGEGPSPWDREPRLQHQRNVATIFGGSAVEEEESDAEETLTENAEHSDHAPAAAAQGTIEEEEIEEEEADLASYVAELEEDAGFDEMEEETQAAEDYRQSVTHEIAASGEPPTETVEPLHAEPLAGAEGAELTNGEEEVDEAAEEEAELEEAQAEAEAMLAAEAVATGTVEAQAEIRAPAATAGYTQRAPRPAFDRRGGPRGRRGGRRFRRHEPQQLPQISDLLKEGQEILVQIAKEPIGKKGARITSHIALPGRFLVYMPTVNHTGVSRKISSDEERQRLKRIVLSERENGHGGFIVRTAAQNASEEELRADIRFLKNLWNEIRGRADSSKPPALIYHDLNVVERVLRDQVTSDFAVIWVDTEQEYERILRFANRFQPALVKRVKLYSKETPLYDQFGLSEEINKALKSKVWLKSGGYIVINQTEALVAIDVNTGKYVGKTARLEDTIVKTNVDAIKEIVRQVRLRDLGGIIVIDFIDMDERRNRQKVMQALEEALRADRAPSKVLQFNDFGLVAITRKRVKQSLERTIGSPCPYCQSTGFVKSVTTVCNEIYVEMRKLAKQLEHSDVLLRVHPEVAKALKLNSGKLLNEMEELTKKTVIVKSDPALHQEQFDIN
jgi:Rne/Rng family ribonuclease